MKAITLTQPWATLVAIGAKRIETRSWGTTYRGPLAIHAAKGWTKADQHLFFREPFYREMVLAGYNHTDQLPRGCIVARAELVGDQWINPITRAYGWEWDGPDGTHYKYELGQKEKCFGDYADGRHAWLLDRVIRLLQPIPARGALGLWEWEPPLQVARNGFEPSTKGL